MGTGTDSRSPSVIKNFSVHSKYIMMELELKAYQWHGTHWLSHNGYWTSLPHLPPTAQWESFRSFSLRVPTRLFKMWSALLKFHIFSGKSSIQTIPHHPGFMIQEPYSSVPSQSGGQQGAWMSAGGSPVIGLYLIYVAVGKNVFTSVWSTFGQKVMVVEHELQVK